MKVRLEEQFLVIRESQNVSIVELVEELDGATYRGLQARQTGRMLVSVTVAL